MAGASFWPPVVFHALEAAKEGGKGRSTVVERSQYITRQKFFWIFCNLSLTFSKNSPRTCIVFLQIRNSNFLITP